MSRIEQEKQTVEQMIRLHCRKKEERNFVPAMQGSVGICTCTVVTLSIRRKERYLPTLYHTLLQTGDAGTDERNHEMGRAKNVVISSGSGYPAFVAGVY